MTIDTNAIDTNATAPSAPTLDATHGIHLLREMKRIRCFEEKCAELYSASKIRGFLHLYVGEEAVAVGVMQALSPQDAVVATYREHGQALARGISARSVMAEMYGRLEGCARGRGGSMHIFDVATRFYGGNAIVGGGLPIAVGLALADQLQGQPHVTTCFFGDGAVPEGAFHESMNLAALWRLPVLFVCENNLYAMGTAIERALSNVDIASHAARYNMPAVAVDGMDVLAVEAAARSAAQTVREGGGPCFIECRTYRFRAHSMFDAELYRDKSEVERWKLRDPILRLQQRLRDGGFLSDADAARIDSEVEREVDDAVTFSERATLEPIEELTRFVYAERAAEGGSKI